MTWPPHDGGLNGSASLILLLGRIDERTERTAEIVEKIEDRLTLGDNRMQRSEQRMDVLAGDLTALRLSGSKPVAPSQSRLTVVLAALTGIAPVKEWMIGAVFVAAGLKGILAPGDYKDILMSYFK